MSDVLEFVVQAILEVAVQFVGNAVSQLLGLSPGINPVIEDLLGLGVISGMAVMGVVLLPY